MANEQLDMDDILNEAPAVPAEPAAPTEPAAPADPAADEAARVAAEEQRKEDYKSKRNKARDKEAVAQGKVRDPDTGQYVDPKDAPVASVAPVAPAPVPAPPAAAPQQEFTDKEKAFLRAAQEERGKRQELERRLAAMEAAKPKEADKPFWDDPEGAIAKQNQAMERMRAEFRHEVAGTRLATFEQIARTKYPDFQEKVVLFGQLASANPNLANDMMSAPDPAEFAYRTASTHKAVADAGGVAALLAKKEKDTRAVVRAEIEAELKAKAEADRKAREAIPGSLSDARSTGSTNRTWGGPEAMEDILKG